MACVNVFVTLCITSNGMPVKSIHLSFFSSQLKVEIVGSTCFFLQYFRLCRNPLEYQFNDEDTLSRVH